MGGIDDSDLQLGAEWGKIRAGICRLFFGWENGVYGLELGFISKIEKMGMGLRLKHEAAGTIYRIGSLKIWTGN